MKKFLLSILPLIIILITPRGSFPLPVSGNQNPTAKQKAIISDLLEEISGIQKDIEAYYIDLKEKNRIIKDESLIPLLSEKRSFYGTRPRFLYSEDAHITWSGNKIAELIFTQRKGEIGTTNILIKRISFQTDNTSEINYIVTEMPSSGGLNRINFRFVPPDNKTRDGMETVKLQGIPTPIMVVYVRDADTKINILRENLRLLKLTKRRVDWFVTSENERNNRKVRSLLEN